MASVDQTMKAVNEACHARGGKYAGYSCKTVSWDDVQRGTVGGGLSCWGANITDTYLTAKDGRQLFTVRSDNWNEKLGHVTASQLALVQGNQEPGDKNNLSPITLRSFLKNSKKFGGYAGLETADLSDDALDQKCSIRFQTTFLPVENVDKATIQFSSEAYNYNTRSDDDPRNLVLLCTTQGIALQQDGKGQKKVFHHSVDDNGKIHRYWLEAERSKHKVGGAQVETKEEKEDAIKRGKATSSVIGVKAMGTRFNVLMTIQIPLEQQKKPEPRYTGLFTQSFGNAIPLGSGFSFGGGGDDDLMAMSGFGCAPKSASFGAPKFKRCSASRGSAPRPKVGTANAARVSRGTEVDVWKGLGLSTPKRNAHEHVTITVVIYFTIAGGVPSEADVVAAIDDMETLYDSCNASGRLADGEFDFMKSELTVKDCQDISAKIKTQPYVPASKPVDNFDQFPEDMDY